MAAEIQPSCLPSKVVKNKRETDVWNVYILFTQNEFYGHSYKFLATATGVLSKMIFFLKAESASIAETDKNQGVTTVSLHSP